MLSYICCPNRQDYIKMPRSIEVNGRAALGANSPLNAGRSM